MSRTKDELHDEGNVDLARRLFAAYISHKERIGLDDAFKGHASELPGEWWLRLAKMIEPGLAAARGNPWPTD